ncbi:polygalacturonase [Senna tora]|uniref:Polygalacturonase n=1 Tax=Senna tora TaxID=362788 RepID=A0A834TZ97_9FABA|nr:polygalacturonase [Senna tora]
MKRSTSCSFLLFFMFLLIFDVFITSSVITVEARKNHMKRSRPHKQHQKHHSNGHSQGSQSPSASQMATFDVMSFGAKGNGVSDDSKALVAAWEAACKVAGATVKIPAQHRFLINPITLQGPCMPHLTLQIDGTVLAPSEASSWPKSSLFQWLNFKLLHNFTIQGSGTIDGQGSDWWTPSQIYNMQKRFSKQIPGMKPTAIRLYSSNVVTVRDIRIINSPLCHLKFDNSKGITVNNITISSPENSPNTDGIHLQNSQDVEILHSHIGTGDDCVSIQTGCSNIHIHHINCGPGHGISLGGLGKDRSVACVSNIMVNDVWMQNTLYGVRIKTWQGGSGTVKNVSFSRIQVEDVKVPIVIDQYYCDKHVCKNQTGTVAICGVKFDEIRGSYAVQPIHVACSNSIPCTDLHLINIQLSPSLHYRGFQQPLCSNSYGNSQPPLLPSPIHSCLTTARPFIKRISRSHDALC